MIHPVPGPLIPLVTSGWSPQAQAFLGPPANRAGMFVSPLTVGAVRTFAQEAAGHLLYGFLDNYFMVTSGSWIGAKLAKVEDPTIGRLIPASQHPMMHAGLGNTFGNLMAYLFGNVIATGLGSVAPGLLHVGGRPHRTAGLVGGSVGLVIGALGGLLAALKQPRLFGILIFTLTLVGMRRAATSGPQPVGSRAIPPGPPFPFGML